MSKFAEIVVHSYVSCADETSVFDYIIPYEYESMIKAGMRVIVPFGNNRLLEGYVLSVKETTEVEQSKLKSIAGVPDICEIFNEKQIALAKWISEEYTCSLIDSLKCMMPPDIVLKANKVVTLNYIDEKRIMMLSPAETGIIEIIKNHQGSILYSQLCKIIDNSAVKALRNMIKSDIISVKSNMESNVKDKIVKGISLNLAASEIDDYIDTIKNDKRLKNQADILKAFKTIKDSVPEKELVEEYGFKKSTINSLIKKGILKSMEIRVVRDPYSKVHFPKFNKPVLMYEQKKVIEEILSRFYKTRMRNYLIHGVTGSGKTEVYMQLIEHMVNQGKQAIMLVPEISLTPQTIERFKGRFGRVAVIHSRLSAGERYDEWRRIKDGEVDVVVGARSAVFVPLDNVGIIVIDEEHENSYKSDKTPKYHTREVAYERCKIENAIFVLGSATPSIETYYKAKNGEYVICSMNKRVDDKRLPEIELVDMREEIISGNKMIFSRRLYDEINNALNNKSQIILFLNRRGFSTFVSCRKCGLVLKCPNCDVSLTYHMDRNLLNCHYCDYTMRSPDICPKCGSRYIKYFGIGTQKVESEVRKCFPEAKVLRMDLDTTSRKGSHDKIYSTFKNRGADILIGTQMISKGLDFPGVTLVGIIAADMTLNLPDYKSCERTFQLITQVSGRAGRGNYEGRVIVQTYNPDHYSIQSSLNHDYAGFYNKEILIRKAFKYPPYCDLINIVVASKTEKHAKEVIKKLTGRICSLKEYKDKILVLGPSPAPISKIKNYYRWQTIIKGEADRIFKRKIKAAACNTGMDNSDVKISVDINPVSMI